MSKYLWAATGERWEIRYDGKMDMWYIVNKKDCPFFLNYYARFHEGSPPHCKLCGQEAEPAVFFQGRQGWGKAISGGPYCVRCISSGPTWGLDDKGRSKFRVAGRGGQIGCLFPAVIACAISIVIVVPSICLIK